MTSINQINETVFRNLCPFIEREVQVILTEVLQNSPYNSVYSNVWIETICQKIIEKLTNSNKNFKYISHCILISKGGNEMDLGGACYWDSDSDGSITIRWDNKYLACVVNVYGCAI